MTRHHVQNGLRAMRVAAAGSLLLLASCSTPKENETTGAVGTPVKIVHPSTSSLVESMEFNATTAFLKKEIIRSTFQGYVQKTNKAIGDKITEGDVVLSLKTKEALAAESAGITPGGKGFQGVIAMTAKSPGVLIELNFHAGDYVGEGEQLAAIANPSSIAVLLNVPYQDASHITVGAHCTVVLPTGKELAATVANVLPLVDPVSQTQTFIISCPEMTHVPMNLNLVVRFSVHEARNAVVLPKRAIQSNETLDSFWVMMMANDSTAVKVPVVKGTENDSLVQILTPSLHTTDRILVEGGYGLPDTARVSIEN
jgi:multidrug efflux pump subunit AcrA (membrane-fusion protein)